MCRWRENIGADEDWVKCCYVLEPARKSSYGGFYLPTLEQYGFILFHTTSHNDIFGQIKTCFLLVKAPFLSAAR